MVTVTLPVDYNRNYARAPFTDMVFTTTALLNAHLVNPVRYPGQIVSLVEAGVVTLHKLSADTLAWEAAGGAGGGSGTAVATSDKLKMIEALANSTTTTWLGDSITENLANGYIRHIDALFPDNTFTDRAVGGHTSIDMVSTQLPLAVADNAEHYVIAIGLNDIRYWNGVGGTGETTISGYLANIKTATDALKATTESPAISVINIFPTAWKDGSTELSHHDQIEKTREWNDALEAFCSTEGLFYIDVFDAIYDSINAHNALTLYSDSVHPSSDLTTPSLDTGSLLYASAILNDLATSTAEELIPTGEHFFKVVFHDPELAASGGYIILKNVDVDVIEDFALSQSTSVTTNLYNSTFTAGANYQNDPFEFDYSMMFSTATYPADGVSLTSAFSGTGFPRGPKSFSTYYSKNTKAISDPNHESWELVAQELSNDGVAVNVLPPSRKGFYYKFQANGTGTLNMKKIDMGVAPIRVNFQNLTVAGLSPRFADFFKGNLTLSGDGMSGNQPNYIITFEAPYELSELDIEAFSGLTDYTIYRSFDGQALSSFSHPSWTNLGSGTQDGIIKLEKLGIGAGSTGVLEGGSLTIGAPTSTFTISAGNGLIIDTHTDANNPVSVAVSWPECPNCVLTDIAGSAYTSVAIDQAGAIVQRPNGGFSVAERRDFILLGTIIHQDNLVIDSISDGHQVSFGGLHSVYDVGLALGNIIISGNEYSGAGLKTIKRSAGQTFGLGSNYTNDKKNPNTVTHPVEDPASFNYHRTASPTTFSYTVGDVDINTGFYDDGLGNLVALGNNRFKIDRIYFLPSAGINITHYGQAEYTNFTQAVLGLSTEKFKKNPILAGAILQSFLIIKKGAADLTDTAEAIFVGTDKFGEKAQGGIGSVQNENMRWEGEYIPATSYLENDVVRDNNWTMIANKDTDDRPSPQPIGEAFSVYDLYDGDLVTAQSTAKQIIYGQRYDIQQAISLRSYTIHHVIGNNYRVFSIKDPLGTPIINELISFEATKTGSTKYNVDPLIVSAGTVFDIAVIESEPNPTPVTFSGAWTYLKPTQFIAPLSGEITQSGKESSVINVHKTDNATGDRSTELEGLDVGDQFSMVSSNWIVQAVVDNTTYMSYSVAPAAQSVLSGLQTFIFETVTATPLTYHNTVDHFLPRPSIRGFFVADDGYANIVLDDDAYGIDIEVQEIDISDDWEVVSAGNTASDSSNVIVPFTVTNSVGLAGNDGRAVTANTESIPFNGSGTGWTSGADGSTGLTGNYYEVQYSDSVVNISASARFNANFSSQLSLYKNGNHYRTLSQYVNDSGKIANYLSKKGEFAVGDKISFGDSVGGTLTNNVPAHFLSIVETAQSSGTVFATDSNKEDSMVRLFGGAGHGSTNTKIRNFSGTSEIIIGSAITRTLSATLGASFLINETGVYGVTYSDDANAAFEVGLTLNSSQLTTPFTAVTLTDRLSSDFETVGAGAPSTASYYGILRKGDVIRAHTNGAASSNLAALFTITKQSVNVDNLIIENFGTVVAASTLGTGELENVFSARVDNAPVPVLVSQSSQFIASQVKSVTGQYTINYDSNFFGGVTPSVVATPLTNGTFCNILSSSATQVIVQVQDHLGSLTNGNIAITVTRQGTDYKSKANYIDSLLIENPEGEFETETYSLPSNISTVSTIHTFNTIVGEKYLIGGKIRFSGNNNNTEIKWDDGATNILQVYRTVTSIISDVIQPNTIYTATSTTLTVHVSSTTGMIIIGNSTTNGSALQLTKLPKKLGVDQLGQVVTNHVTGGTEYELKGQLWNGKQIYARSYETSINMAANGVYNLDTVETTLNVISLTIFGNSAGGGGWYEMAGSGASVGYVGYNKNTGDIVMRGDGYAHTEQRATFTYYKD